MLESESYRIARALPSSCEGESLWAYMKCRLLEIAGDGCSAKRPRAGRAVPDGCDGNGSAAGATDGLISAIGRDNSINCLVRCSRSDYGALACVNGGIRQLIRSGELYRLRRLQGIAEQWIYFSCSAQEWVAYDPYRRRWMNLPTLPYRDPCFVCSDRESLAVGTELLVFGVRVFNPVELRYSILTNTWSSGVGMNTPRHLFASASFGEKAIVAGGTGSNGSAIFSSAELYNSETRTWTTLPSMNKPRTMCSGVFMDGKFYVIGGRESKTELLTCGEEYDFEKRTWRVIPNMSMGLNGTGGAPPLVAVVKNELYAADYTQREVKRYDKMGNTWITLGGLPERPDSTNGWGIAFRACGDRLVVIGGPRVHGGGMIELHAWKPDSDAPPDWTMIASKHSPSFVFNCAVMSC